MKNRTLTRTVTAAVLAGGLSVAGLAPAQATSPSTTQSTGSVAASTVSQSHTPATPATPLRLAAAGTSGEVAPQAANFAIRAAIRAGMEVLKRTSTTWYNAIRTQLNNGRTAFTNWWNTSVPGPIKTTVYGVTGGVGGNALYDALLWVFGLD